MARARPWIGGSFIAGMRLPSRRPAYRVTVPQGGVPRLSEPRVIASSVGEKDRFVVPRAVKDVNHNNLPRLDAIKDQIITVNRTPQPASLVTRNERTGKG